MKKIIAFLTICTLSISSVNSQDHKSEKWYSYIDETGKEIIKISAKNANHFSDGVAVITKYYWDGGEKAFWNDALIDPEGNILLPPHYERIMRFRNGVSFAKKRGDDFFSLIDKKGNILSDIKFDRSYAILDGIIMYKENGKVGFINTEGQVIVPPNKYVDGSGFEEGYACVAIEKDANTWLYGFVDKEGNEVVPCSFRQDGTSSFNGGLARMRFSNGKTGFITPDGKVAIAAKYGTASSFNEGFYPAAFGKNRTLWGLVDSNNITVIPGKYDYMKPVFKGTVQVELKGKHGYLKTDGAVLIPIEYDEFSSSFEREGVAVLSKGNKKYVYNIAGELIFESDQYRFINPDPKREIIIFGEEASGKWGIMNFKGETILAPNQFCFIGPFNDQLALVRYCK